MIKKAKKAKISHSDNSEKLRDLKFKYIDASGVQNPAKLLDFIEWSALPRKARHIKNQGKFAEVVGVHPDTLSDWKKLSGFWGEVSIYRGQNFHKYCSDYMYGQVESAKRGNPASAKLLLQFFEGFSEKTRVQDLSTPREITKEESDKIRIALINMGLAGAIMNENELENNK